jgi:hypothetical protein
MKRNKAATAASAEVKLLLFVLFSDTVIYSDIMQEV